MCGGAAGTGLDLRGRPKLIGYEGPQRTGIMGGIGNDMTDTRKLDSSPTACGLSPCCPGVGWIRTGRPMASTAACSLVVRPPRERPIAAASAPSTRFPTMLRTAGTLAGSALLPLPHRHGP